MGGNCEYQSGLVVERHGNCFYGADMLVTQWVARRIPGFEVHDRTRAIGILANNKMAGGVVYEQHNGPNIQASIAGTPGVNWLTRDTLYQIFAYPFITLDCLCITLLVSSKNTKSLRLVTKMGFEGEAIVKFAAHDGSDLIILKMFKQDCRWLRHGKRTKQPASAA